ncbi:VOC family protein [Actinomadura sp. PM05-2]|uniref:VOC family protein n=2 Tax=Actinomadura parmotrematis TaxID=2864039 RepID=A0ABS7G5H0_9ACTN|nr:VOC family protein [Actinomadura parmotrematis]
MDALYPRLLVDDFPACALFYERVLRELLGIEPAKVVPQARYASWDAEGGTLLSLFDRAALAEAVGAGGPPDAAARDRAMLTFRVPDVDAAAATLTGFGARPVAAPQDRPQWGPGLRTAHLRDPEGNLLELQSY